MLKNITLSADEELIEAARQRATQQNTTLNAEFRVWLQNYTQGETEGERRARAFRETMAKLEGKIDTGGRKFTRDEMNER